MRLAWDQALPAGKRSKTGSNGKKKIGERSETSGGLGRGKGIVGRTLSSSRTTARLASLADSFSSFSLGAELTYAKLFAKSPGIK